MQSFGNPCVPNLVAQIDRLEDRLDQLEAWRGNVDVDLDDLEIWRRRREASPGRREILPEFINDELTDIENRLDHLGLRFDELDRKLAAATARLDDLCDFVNRHG